MRNMIRWKMCRTARDIFFYIIASIAMVVAFAYLPSSLHDGIQSAAELTIATSSRIASMLVLVIGLYASGCITHDVHERFLSVAIASGNGSFSVVLAEMLGFIAVVFTCVLVPSLLVFAIGIFIPGLSFGGGILVVKTIIWILAYSAVCSAAFGIVLPLCLVVKSEGMSCIVNLIVVLGFWSVAEAILEAGGTDALQSLPARLFPFTQLFMLCALDPELPGFWGGMLFALAGAMCFALLLLWGSCLLFAKMEKK